MWSKVVSVPPSTVGLHCFDLCRFGAKGDCLYTRRNRSPFLFLAASSFASALDGHALALRNGHLIRRRRLTVFHQMGFALRLPVLVATFVMFPGMLAIYFLNVPFV